MTLKTLLLAASATLSLSATAASASPFDHASLTYGHDTWTQEDSSSTDGSWARVDLGASAFGLKADFGMSQGYLGEDEQATILSFALGKELGNLTVGTFYDLPLFDGEKEDVRHFGVEVSYDLAGLELAGFVGRGDFYGDKSRVQGASVTADIGHGFDAGAFYNYETIDDFDMDFSEAGMNLGYTVTALPLEMRVAAYVSHTNTSFDIFEFDTKTVGFSVSVPLQQGGEATKGTPRMHGHSTIFNAMDYVGGFMAP